MVFQEWLMPDINSESSMTASDIAEKLNSVCLGEKNISVECIAPLEKASKSCLTFIKSKHPEKASKILEKLPACTILINEFSEELSFPDHLAVIQVKNPLAALVEIIPLFYKAPDPIDGISSHAVVDPSAKIGNNCSIGDFCSVGANVEIGDNVTIYPNVVIYPNVKIGDNCILHSGSIVREGCQVSSNSVLQNGAIIGAEGFGYFPDSNGNLVSIPQIGNTVLESGVDVGANSCIDRATLGSTRIGAGTKLDNHVQIGHNVEVGSSTIICGQTGIAGSAKIGNNVTLAAQSGVGDHIKITDNCRTAAKTGVINDITKAGDYGGFPAVPIFSWRRQIHALNSLTGRLKDIMRLIKEKRGD